MAVQLPAKGSERDLANFPVQWLAFMGTLFAIAILNTIIYLPRMSAPFVFDSILLMRDNSALERWSIGGSRWLAMATFAWDRSLYGDNVWGYHATSVAVHLLTAALVFWTVYVTLGFVENSSRLGRVRLPVASFTAILWSVHPLQTQAVLYTVQRMETLMAMFFLAALLLFALGLQARISVPYLLASAACYFASAGCKEVAIALPPVLFVYDFVLSDSKRSTIPANLAWIVKQRGWFYGLLALISFVFTPSLSLVLQKLPTVAIVKQEFSAQELESRVSDIGNVAGVTPLDYLLTQSKVITKYLQLACFPRGQNFDHAMEISSSAVDRLFYPFILGLGCIFIIVAVSRRWLIGLGLAAFLLVLAPTSSILPIRDLMVEHRMYLPLMALITLLCGLFFVTTTNRGAAMAVGVAICLLLTGVSVARVVVYRSGVALWSDAVAKNPENGRALGCLAKSLYAEGKLQQALETFEQAIALTNTRLRIPTLTTSAELRIELSKVQNDLAVLQTRKKNYSSARKFLQDAISNDPLNAAAHSSLGNVFVRLGDRSQAVECYRTAIDIDSNMESAKQNLAAVSRMINADAERTRE